MLGFELKVDLKIVRNLIRAASNTEVKQTQTAGSPPHFKELLCLKKKKERHK